MIPFRCVTAVVQARSSSIPKLWFTGSLVITVSWYIYIDTILATAYVFTRLFQVLNKICRLALIQKSIETTKLIGCRLLSCSWNVFARQQVFASDELHPSRFWQEPLLYWRRIWGDTPHLLLSVVGVRLSGPDKPGWFPCHFDGHQFDLLKFPWLPGAISWNPQWYLFSHFLSLMQFVEIRLANISAAL